jgi:hypothetical protein
MRRISSGKFEEGDKIRFGRGKRRHALGLKEPPAGKGFAQGMDYPVPGNLTGGAKKVNGMKRGNGSGSLRLRLGNCAEGDPVPVELQDKEKVQLQQNRHPGCGDPEAAVAAESALRSS